MKKVLIGTSGYNYKSWKGKFYPEGLLQKDWLSYFSTKYETVEINATFYRSFPFSVFEKWSDITPDNLYSQLRAQGL